MPALLGINVTEGRVSLFSLKQVNMPYLFQPPKSSAEEQSSELRGAHVYVWMCVFDYEHEHMHVCKRLCIQVCLFPCIVALPIIRFTHWGMLRLCVGLNRRCVPSGWQWPWCGPPEPSGSLCRGVRQQTSQILYNKQAPGSLVTQSCEQCSWLFQKERPSRLARSCSKVFGFLHVNVCFHGSNLM